jgi:type I restriction enzyme S subunit
MSLLRYSVYKDSAVEWLGEVPEHWDIYDSKRIFKNRRELALDTDEQLAASQKHGVIPQTLMMKLNDSKVMLALKGTESFRHVEENDFVISLRSFEGGIEHSKYNGCVSPAYTVLNSQKNIDANFYRYLFKSIAFIAELQSTTDSLRDGKSITYQQFGNIPLVLPSLEEQSAIVSFLDHETTKIDELITEQKRLIEILKEKRQAVISHAVTKGLNPDAKMKDSGIEWLGLVPEHWKVLPLKWFSSCCSGNGLSTDEIEVEATEKHRIPVIGGNGLMGFTDKQNIFHSVLAVGRVGALCGNVHSVHPPAWITDNALVLDASLLYFNSFYLANVLRKRNLNDIASKTAQPLITGSMVSDQRIPCPPIIEQVSINIFLDKEIIKFDELTAEAQRAIDLLQERRTALISAAVTGKIDVRGLA